MLEARATRHWRTVKKFIARLSSPPWLTTLCLFSSMYRLTVLMQWMGLPEYSIFNTAAGAGPGANVVLFAITFHGLLCVWRQGARLTRRAISRYRAQDDTPPDHPVTSHIRKRGIFAGLGTASGLLLSGPFFGWPGPGIFNLGVPAEYPLWGLTMALIVAYGCSRMLHSTVEVTIGKLRPHWIYRIPKDTATTP